MASTRSEEISVEELVKQGVAAVQAGDKSRARELLTEALDRDPKNELAWIWIADLNPRDAARKYCLERVLEINPKNKEATDWLKNHSSEILSESPFPKGFHKSANPKCTYPGCEIRVSKPGYKYCLEHWKQTNSHVVSESRAQYGDSMLLVTAIGEKMDLSSRKINLILAELGWIASERKGWIPTSQGKALGAVRKDHSQTGKPFVLWPKSIVGNKVLLNTIADFKGEQTLTSSTSQHDIADFRKKFPAEHRATDGHWVRSKAELLIDNWLYVEGQAHAYERRLPIEEEVYCDFYIPGGKVYIEYWGLERDSKYQTRMNTKRELYDKYKLNLIELTDEHIRNLDDYLPKMLLKFNVIVN